MATVPAVRRRRVTAVWLLTFLLPVILIVTGCSGLSGTRRGGVVPGGTPTATPTTGPDAFERSGRGMPIRITLPPPGTPRPYPLIVALHSLHYDGTDPKAHWDLDGLARTAGLAVVYPDGIGKAWNAGTCCDTAKINNTDDVGWLRALIAHLSENYPIDRTRVSLIGLSNGGMLAYRYACEHGDELAGIAVVAASRQVAQCQPAAPLTVVVVHGGADGHVPYLGSQWSPVLQTAITPVEESMAPFRVVDQCPLPSQPGDTILTDSTGVPWHAAQSPTALSAGQQPAVAIGSSAAPTPPSGTPTPLPDGLTAPAGPPAVPVTTAPVAVRRETRCASSARVVQYLLPSMAHGWPPATGPNSFATTGVIWNLLAPARSARPGPRL
ncbi:poly(3-hydroxybutyrate) depolymerase [Frankia torreyi]|uniref:Poly(3-hydroxybutyrate) depolymerase n=1 Tax=Frankia torreyi TaxID=1856 RepID=A0A0D8BF19_9ACTN|nr:MULTISPECIES: PHB depolymerase family esterase [Frankia]KJE22858.1 poly(3-hydroxybutyrate) depolymerase [Frankia torreyi]KQC40274.1 plasmid partitioning protein [Frankia sp. ACN1ag]KQM04904.1 poly(3-hydroxybutyrate) depolymerase [Frankia sp. CpI1-P]